VAKPLNPKQKQFVLEYLIDKNATKAAIRAGYSRKTAYSIGQRLLKNVEIAREIKIALREREDRLELKADTIIRELIRIGMVDVRTAFNEDGTLKAIKDLSEDLGRAISGIEVEEIYRGTGEDRKVWGVTKKIKFWKKTEALELLGKHLKLFIERLDITGKIKLEDIISKSHDEH